MRCQTFCYCLKTDCKHHHFLSQRSSGCLFHDAFSFLDYKLDSYSGWCFNRFCYCITSIFIVIYDNSQNLNMYALFHIEYPSISLYQNNFSKIKLMKGEGIRKHSLHETNCSLSPLGQCYKQTNISSFFNHPFGIWYLPCLHHIIYVVSWLGWKAHNNVSCAEISKHWSYANI